MDKPRSLPRVRPWIWIAVATPLTVLLARCALLRTMADAPGAPRAPGQGASLGARPGAATTEGILGAQGPACLACVQKNGCLDPAQQGNRCERTEGRAHPFQGAVAGGASCASVLANPEPTESEVCLQTLQGIFSSTCASARWLTPCLCGKTDPASCLGGTAPPTGPLAGLYACDFHSAQIMDIQSNFMVQTFGAGTANALVLCAAQSECPCFGD